MESQPINEVFYNNTRARRDCDAQIMYCLALVYHN